MTTEKEAATGVGHHPQPPPPKYEGAAASQPPVAYPQPDPPPHNANYPPPHNANYPPPNYYPQGYVVAGATPAPLRAERLRCCGCGIGWFLFIIGFFLAGIPWYCGAIILLCARTIDKRERPGLIACTIAAVLSTIAAIIEGIIRAVVQG